MNLRKLSYAGAGTAAVLVVFIIFFTIPLVPYTSSFDIPGNTFGKPTDACMYILNNGQTGPVVTYTFNATQEKEFEACLVKNAYPPVALNGSATLAYSTLGYGAPPYPKYGLAVQGTESLLVFFKGPRVAYVEGPFDGALELNPPGLVSVENQSIVSAGAGSLNFTATIRNVGTTAIWSIGIIFDYPGYGANKTTGGLTWHSSPFADYLPPCSYTYLAPGATCSVNYLIGASPWLQSGANYTLRCIVTGSLPPSAQSTGSQTTTTASGYPPGFIFVSTTQVTYPGAGPNPEWVREFIALVNGQRGGMQLTEDSALDSFAQTRFNTAVTEYSISDYGFDNQSAQFFVGTGRISTEEILYPGLYSPSAFANYIQQYAPGHWSTLENTAYTKFGYYLGVGPVVAVENGCPVTEITQRNVNITQIAIENGCKYKVEDVTYLLFVLSN